MESGLGGRHTGIPRASEPFVELTDGHDPSCRSNNKRSDASQSFSPATYAALTSCLERDGQISKSVIRSESYSRVGALLEDLSPWNCVFDLVSVLLSLRRPEVAAHSRP